MAHIEMELTIGHKFLKTFLLIMNVVGVIVLIVLTIQAGFSNNLLVGVLMLIIVDFYLVNEMKKIRGLIYKDKNLISVKFDNTEERIDLNSIRSIKLTGGRVSNFYIYKVEYMTSENTLNYFLVAPLRNNRFNDFLTDLKMVNKGVMIKRIYP